MAPTILALNPGVIALLAILAFGGVLIFAIIMLKRHTNLFHKDEKPSDEKIVKDELNRMLEEVKDEDTKKAMEDFSKNHPTDENKKPEDHQ
ncbi:MAG: hypothetical protein MJ208_01840 [Bacilli bacterium]|nr:hypothetical protein [Bacilli bacterium]